MPVVDGVAPNPVVAGVVDGVPKLKPPVVGWPKLNPFDVDD